MQLTYKRWAIEEIGKVDKATCNFQISLKFNSVVLLEP